MTVSSTALAPSGVQWWAWALAQRTRSSWVQSVSRCLHRPVPLHPTGSCLFARAVRLIATLIAQPFQRARTWVLQGEEINRNGYYKENRLSPRGSCL